MFEAVCVPSVYSTLSYPCFIVETSLNCDTAETWIASLSDARLPTVAQVATEPQPCVTLLGFESLSFHFATVTRSGGGGHVFLYPGLFSPKDWAHWKHTSGGFTWRVQIQAVPTYARSCVLQAAFQWRCWHSLLFLPNCLWLGVWLFSVSSQGQLEWRQWQREQLRLFTSPSWTPAAIIEN